MTRGPDVENVLIYNVGPAVFRDAATDFLRIESRNGAVPQPPRALCFDARHHVRYQVIELDQIRSQDGDLPRDSDLAVCGPVRCNCSDLKHPASLWRLFKRGMKCVDGESWLPGTPFKVQLIVSAPKNIRLNLADIVKPMVDAFISSLHYYDGKQLESVVERLATQLECERPEVRALLLEATNAALGPYAVPHLRADGLQWSPADDLLIAGEFIREHCDSVSVRGRLLTG